MKNTVKKVLRRLKTDALLVSEANSVLYLSGFKSFMPKEREAFLLLTRKGNFIFTSSLYAQAVRENIKDFKLVEIDRHNVFSTRLKEIIDDLKIVKISADLTDLTVAEYVKIRKIVKVVDDENIVKFSREIKTESEIENLKKASGLADLIFKYIKSEIKLGITEIEIAKKIEIFVLQNNARLSFDSVVAFGPNSSLPHHIPTNKKLSGNSIVLLDFGVVVNNYCSDMTRTVYFGCATAEFKRIYKTVLDSQKIAFDAINNGERSLSKVDKVARDYIVSKGYEPIPHSLGHGIGLEVHELPRLSPGSNSRLKKGMVFSIEPGIYIPQFGGVRIEDLHLFDGKNAQLLSHAQQGIIEI